MIEVRNAHKALGEFSLRGVDLRIESGEYFVVLGPTGAGKTVLIECIAGLHRLEQGTILLEDRDVTHLATERRNVGYVPQDYVLFPHMSLRENIEFSLNLIRTPREIINERVGHLTKILRIDHLLDRRPRTLSGGEQQRGALARALATRPTVLLLDEPLSALDEGTRAELSVLLAEISEKIGTTVIHVCHNFDEALELGDRIAIMRAGRIVQVGPPSEVLRKPGSEFLANFVGARNVFDVSSSDTNSGRLILKSGVMLSVNDIPQGTELLASIRPEEISICNQAATDVKAQNTVPCILTKVEDRGRHIRLHLDGPLPLVSHLTPQAYREAQVQAGDNVIASFGSDSVHVFNRD